MKTDPVKNIRRQLSFLTGSTEARFFVVIVAFVLLCSGIMFMIEHKKNPEYHSFLDSVYWSVVTTATVGYGDIAPKTQLGRAVAVVIILVGAAFMGVFIGRISTMLLERQMKEEQGLLDFSAMKNHFIITGWKREMPMVLRDIAERNSDIAPSSIVLVNRAPVDEVKSVLNAPEFREVRFVHGAPIEERDLVRAGVKGAKRILVLADFYTEGNVQNIDSKTVMAVMSIKNLNRTAYVCAELLDTKFEKYLRLSHCDEVLLSRDFSRMMLSSASQGSGLTHIIQSLLSKDSPASIATAAIPHNLVGRTFGEIRGYFASVNSTLVLGLLENTGNIVDRKKEALREAQKNPDISKLIPDLRNAKTLVANEPVINPPDSYVVKQHSMAILVSGSTCERSGS